jgi:hypothetical protein
MVGLGNEAVHSTLKLDDRAKDAAFEAALCELGKEALDRVEPRARSRGEVEDEARVAGQPRLDLRMLVGGVVLPLNLNDSGMWRSM